MDYFDERLSRIKQRSNADSEMLERSLEQVANALSEDSFWGEGSDSAIGEILRYYDIHPLKKDFAIDESFEHLDLVLRPYGIMWRTVTLSDNWHKKSVGAMLAKRTDGTMVALIPNSIFGYDIYDSSTKVTVKFKEHMKTELDKTAVCFYIPFPNQKLNYKNLINYMLGVLSKADLLSAAVAALIVPLAGMIPALINRYIATNVFGADISLLPSIIAMYIGSTIFLSMFTMIKELAFSRIKGKIAISTESAAFMRMLSLPVSFFGKYNSGNLSTRLSALQFACKAIVDMTLDIGIVSVFSLIYILQISKLTPSLCLPALAILIASVGFAAVTAFVQKELAQKKMEVSAELAGIQLALISAIQKLRLAGAEKRAFAKWANVYAKSVKLTYSPPKLIKLNQVISMFITLFGTILIYYAAVENSVSTGDFMAFTVSFGMLTGVVNIIIDNINVLIQIKPALKLADPILKTEPEIYSEKEELKEVVGEISLNRVSFRYSPDMRPVLKDISLKISTGEYVAIVGRTGCGKSTLFKLLLGFEKPEFGNICYDGKDLNQLDMKSLRRKIGIVMQDSRLFSGTIYSNIVASAPWLSIDDAWAAAELVGIAEDIRSMPMGMFTSISENDGGISGGQRQRIMIARAIASKPKILLFDEATSALDNISQKVVSDALDRLNCTRIVIAHRLSTVKNCNRIFVLDEGQIVEEGSFDELSARNGKFVELTKHQRLE